MDFFIRYLLKRAIKYIYVNVRDPALKYEPTPLPRKTTHAFVEFTDWQITWHHLFIVIHFCFLQNSDKIQKDLEEKKLKVYIAPANKWFFKKSIYMQKYVFPAVQVYFYLWMTPFYLQYM